MQEFKSLSRRELENLEGSHTDMRRTCKLHTSSRTPLLWGISVTRPIYGSFSEKFWKILQRLGNLTLKEINTGCADQLSSWVSWTNKAASRCSGSIAADVQVPEQNLLRLRSNGGQGRNGTGREQPAFCCRLTEWHETMKTFTPRFLNPDRETSEQQDEFDRRRFYTGQKRLDFQSQMDAPLINKVETPVIHFLLAPLTYLCVTKFVIHIIRSNLYLWMFSS